MRFFIINTDYFDFIRQLYAKQPNLDKYEYEDQHRIRMDTYFGTADYYSFNLRKLGHEAWDVIANIEPMQQQWAREHGVKTNQSSWHIRFRRKFIPWVYKENKKDWILPILAEQIKFYRPDVIYSMAMEVIDSEFLRSVSGFYHLAVGQHAATPLDTDFSAYDLIITSLPSQIDFFRMSGMKSEMLRLGFETRILQQINLNYPSRQICFVGGLGGIHQAGTETLAYLSEKLPLGIWGYGAERLPTDSPILKNYRGPLWGLDMFQILRDSKITFNRHAELADLHFANNMRLYEATGVGSLLLTDHKKNLAEIFIPGKEILAYRDKNECLELAQYYLEHENEREAIARAGQQRTLRDHTYAQRMQELVEIVERHL